MIPMDTLMTKNGLELHIGFLGHGSLRIDCQRRTLYIDPVGMFADYTDAPQADLILVTHHHDDHCDPALIEQLLKPDGEVISTETVIGQLGYGTPMRNGETRRIDDLLTVETIPAYNTTAGRDCFHPHTGRDNGYLLTIDGVRIYVAGDGEPTPEMLALRDIDIAFLPVNQPYTMTVDQAVATIQTLHPTIFYPYHTGQTEFETDLQQLADRLTGSGTEVRIRPMA